MKKQRTRQLAHLVRCFYLLYIYIYISCYSLTVLRFASSVRRAVMCCWLASFSHFPPLIIKQWLVLRTTALHLIVITSEGTGPNGATTTCSMAEGKNY
jgi:hypothetical protein